MTDLRTEPTPQTARPSEWLNYYSSTFDLTITRAKLEYVNKNYDVCERVCEDALKFVHGLLDRVKIYDLKQELFTALPRAEDAFRVNRQALTELGFLIPFRSKDLNAEQTAEAKRIPVTMENIGRLPFSEALVDMLMGEFDRKLAGRSIASLAETLPECLDSHQQAIAEALASIAATCVVYDHEYTRVVSLLEIIHMLDHGVFTHAHGCSALGMQLLQYPAIVLTRRPEQLADLALALLKKYPRPCIEARTLLCCAFVHLVYQPWFVVESVVQQTRKVAAQSGVILFLSYTSDVRVSYWSMLLDVVELRALIEQEMLVNQTAANEIVASLMLQGQLLGLRILEDPSIEASGDFTLNQAECEFLVRVESMSYLCSASFRIARARALYIMDQAEDAMNLLLPISVATIAGLPDCIFVVIFRIWSTAMVIRQRCKRTFDWGEERRSMWAVVKADMEFLRAWWQVNPSTYGGSYHLAEAEIAYTQLVEQQENDKVECGKFTRIADIYRRAIVGTTTNSSCSWQSAYCSEPRPRLDFLDQGANSNESISCIALVYQRYAEFSLVWNQFETALTLLLTSFRCWVKYRSQNKIRHIMRIYDNEFAQILAFSGAVRPLPASLLLSPNRITEVEQLTTSADVDQAAAIPDVSPISAGNDEKENAQDWALQQWWKNTLKKNSDESAARIESTKESPTAEHGLAQNTRILDLRASQRTQEFESACWQAEQASQTKRQFLANMSHEIRTPLNGVIGGTELLLDPTSSANLTSEQREVLGIVRTSGETMLTMINDILDLSKIEAGRVNLSSTSFPIRECIESAIAMIASNAHSKGLEVQYEAEIDVPHLIFGDYQRLTQILVNLLSNATKFTLKGNITIQVQSLKEDNEKRMDDGECRWFVLHFAVRDTGMGIPAHSQNLLFQPFTQVHSDTARSIGGTGLGLTISKHLVELMGGRMWLESEFGAGSTFHFTIACKGSDYGRPVWLPRPLDVARSISLGDGSLSSNKVLLVHPLQYTRDLIASIIKVWGIGVLAAASIAEARQVLASHSPPSLFAVLTDYHVLSEVEPIDTEMNEPIAIGVQSSQLLPSSHSEELKFDQPQPSFIQPAAISLKYLQLFAQLSYAVADYQQNLRLHSLGSRPIRVIVLAPLSQQSCIRSLIVRDTYNHLFGYITTPIKLSQMYEALIKAQQESDLIATLAANKDSQAVVTTTAIDPADSVESAFDPLAIDRVLIVDDNSVNRKVLLRMLARCGFTDNQLLIAENGKIALDFVHSYVQQSLEQEASFSDSGCDSALTTRLVVLMDILMPVMDGLTSSRAIRASSSIPPTHQPYIIAVTANTTGGEREICSLSGMNDYVSKPISLKILNEALKKAVIT